MIYGASEVLRDLEFVIFDEVHYINNEDVSIIFALFERSQIQGTSKIF